MAKLTVNQMIDRLTPDRQEAVLAKAERITKARETVKFESVCDVLGRVPVDRRVKIEKYADSPALAMEAARLKGKDVDPICGLPPRQTSHGFPFPSYSVSEKMRH